MKKVFKYLLLIGCGAVLASCSYGEDPAGLLLMKAGEQRITLSVGDKADTRVSYTYDEADPCYRFSWSDGDAIGLYIPDRDTPVKFTVTEISDNGKSASFVLAEDYYIAPGEQSVSIVYPFFLDEYAILPGPQSCAYFRLEDMGKYAVLYASDIPMVDGEIGSAHLKTVTSYLHFPTGFQFFTGDKTVEIASSENALAQLKNVYNAFGLKDGVFQPFDSPSYDDIWLDIGSVDMTKEGKLAAEIYVPFFVQDGGQEMRLGWSITLWSESDDCFDYNVVPENAKTVKPGMVYEAQATTFPSREITHWESIISDDEGEDLEP